MAERNRHGLPRTIPEAIKREIRQRCGFGCVKCGLSIYDYEHFDPDFKDAKEHSPAGITLLCMQCNQKRNRKWLSKDSVIVADKNPKALSDGFASEFFDFGSDNLIVQFAGTSFMDCRHVIAIRKMPILTVTKPEEPGTPIRLSGRFCDETGAATLCIDDNQWRAGADNWDVEIKGPRILIRSEPGKLSLILKAEPPNKIVIEKIDMLYDGVYLKGNSEELKISWDNINWSTIKGGAMIGCSIGIQID